jgi:hypothetical protein
MRTLGLDELEVLQAVLSAAGTPHDGCRADAPFALYEAATVLDAVACEKLLRNKRIVGVQCAANPAVTHAEITPAGMDAIRLQAAIDAAKGST